MWCLGFLYSQKERETMADIVIQFKGTIYENGYGQVAQKVMRDKDLSTVAKAIYAYLCSFAGGNPLDDRIAFPGVKLMMAELNIKSEDTYYKHRKQLIDKGYIEVEQEKDKDGKFKRNIYSIVAVPVEKKEEEPHPKKSGTEPSPNFSSTENQDTNINSSYYNQSLIKQEEEEEIIYTEQQHIFERSCEFLNIDSRMKRKILLRIGSLSQYTPDGLYNTFRVLRDRLEAVVRGEKKPIEHLPAWFLETLEGEDTKILMLDAAQVRVLRQKQWEEEEARAKRENAIPFPFYNWLEE
jgi:hypothetical protein